MPFSCITNLPAFLFLHAFYMCDVPAFNMPYLPFAGFFAASCPLYAHTCAVRLPACRFIALCLPALPVVVVLAHTGLVITTACLPVHYVVHTVYLPHTRSLGLPHRYYWVYTIYYHHTFAATHWFTSACFHRYMLRLPPACHAHALPAVRRRLPRLCLHFCHRFATAHYVPAAVAYRAVTHLRCAPLPTCRLPLPPCCALPVRAHPRAVRLACARRRAARAAAASAMPYLFFLPYSSHYHAATFTARSLPPACPPPPYALPIRLVGSFTTTRFFGLLCHYRSMPLVHACYTPAVLPLLRTAAAAAAACHADRQFF